MTVLDVANNRVTQIKTPETDGYAAVQVTFGARRASRVPKPQAGHLAKAGVTAGTTFREFQVPAEELARFKPGDVVGADTFAVGQLVDVTGTTKGRGFSGVIRRWNMAGSVSSHGTHEYFRHGGSIGTNMTPGRTLPGLKMPGHYGDEMVTIHNLRLIKVIPEDQLILIEGGIPGPEGQHVIVRGAVKKATKRWNIVREVQGKKKKGGH